MLCSTNFTQVHHFFLMRSVYCNNIFGSCEMEEEKMQVMIKDVKAIHGEEKEWLHKIS